TATDEPIPAYTSPRTQAVVVPAPRIVVYFSSWGIYARGFNVKAIETSGAAEHANVINYAFAGPFQNRCILADPAADTKTVYGAANSVDGKGNGKDVLKGHFGQLLKLKAMHPDL